MFCKLLWSACAFCLSIATFSFSLKPFPPGRLQSLYWRHQAHCVLPVVQYLRLTALYFLLPFFRRRNPPEAPMPKAKLRLQQIFSILFFHNIHPSILQNVPSKQQYYYFIIYFTIYPHKKQTSLTKILKFSGNCCVNVCLRQTFYINMISAHKTPYLCAVLFAYLHIIC